MMDSRDKKISEFLKNFPEPKPCFNKLLPLARPYLSNPERSAIIKTVIDDWFPTMGPQVEKFESEFSRYMVRKMGVMVNSGSSANLVAIGALKETFDIEEGSEVVVPAMCWSTTVSPLVQYGFVPHFVDVNLSDFNINIDSLESAINKKTRMIMLVHALGFPANIKEVLKIARKHNLKVIEDTCESYGAKIGNRFVGSFGDAATFSFYASHHITTIEGGMILTDNEKIYETARSLRAHGWVRDYDKSTIDKYSKKYPSVDTRFMFVTQGYNLRPTDISGAIGSEQLKIFEDTIEGKRRLAKYWNGELEKLDIFLIREDAPGTRAVWLGYPITLKRKYVGLTKKLMRFLESKGIETRPIISGNFVNQPSVQKIRFKSTATGTAEFINKSSFYIGCYKEITMERAEKVAADIREFVRNEIKH